MPFSPRTTRPLLLLAAFGIPAVWLAKTQAQNSTLGGPIQAVPNLSAEPAPIPTLTPAPKVQTAIVNSPLEAEVIPAQFIESAPQTSPLPIEGRIVRVGLTTAGGQISIYLPKGAVLTDARQGGRAFRAEAGSTLNFSFGAEAEAVFGGKKFRGPISIQTSLGLSQGWQHVQIQVLAGEHARLTTDGKNARYGRPYRGHLEVFRQGAPEPSKRKGPLAVVNVANIEDYLKGVVPWEMSPSAPSEALKAQAICARTKAIQQINSKKFAAGNFDVCDYDACQGYPGTENEKPSTTQAVEATRGQTLFHRGQVIDAVFCTNSGGITAAARDVWSSTSDTPYLRSVRDIDPKSETARVLKSKMSEADWANYITRPWPTFAKPDQAAKDALAVRRAKFPVTAALYGAEDWPEFYRWKRSIPATDVNNAFAARGFSRVSNFEILERSGSGRIRRLNIVGEAKNPDGSTKSHSLQLSGDGQIRAMFSGRLGSTTALPSSMFVVTPQTDHSGQISGWSLQGSGWGHGVGMCQRGAQNHAKAGWDARKIINFYYNDIEIRKIWS